MAITPELARAELARRKSFSSSGTSITPEMARMELKRRQGIQPPPKMEEKIEEDSFLSKAPRSIARGTRNALAGTADTLDFLASPVREGMNLVGKPFGVKFPTLAEETTKSIDSATGGYTAPLNDGEKTQEAYQRAIGGMPIGSGLGMAAKAVKHIPKYIPNLVESTGKFLRGSNYANPTNLKGVGNIAGAAATSGLVQSHLNQNPEDTMGALGAGLSVPVAEGALRLLTKKGRQGKAARTGEFFQINPEAVESFQQAGVTPTLPDVSKGKISKIVQSKLEHTPFASSPIMEAKNLQRTQILEGLGQGELGKTLSKGEASSLIKKGAKGYQKYQEKNFGSMFEKVEKDIENLGDDKVGIENTNKFFEKMFKKFKTSSQEKRFKNSPIGKMYVDLYETAKESGGKLPYYDVKDRLDQINDLITTHGEIGKVSQGKLKQFASNLYKDVEKDIGPKLKELGKDSYGNWLDVKKYYSDYAKNEIPHLNELYKKDKKGATDAFVDLVTNQKKGAEKAKLVLQGLDHKDQIELTDAIHKQLGRSSDGSFSPLKWVRGYKDLDPEAQKVLLSPLNKQTQQKFGAIADTIDHLKSTLAEANTSKTAYHTALVGLSAAGTKALGSLASGNPIPLGSLAGSLFLGNRVSEKMLTNPKFINWMYRGMKAKNLNQFEKIIKDVPHIGNYRKTLQREVQTFQHDLNSAKKEEKKNEK